MTFLSSQIECLFSYNLLALTQRHVVEVVVVECVAHLLPYRIIDTFDVIYKQVIQL